MTNYGLIYKDLKVNNDDPIISTGPIKANGDLSPFLTNIPFNKSSKIEFDPRGNIWITTDGNGTYSCKQDAFLAELKEKLNQKERDAEIGNRLDLQWKTPRELLGQMRQSEISIVGQGN